MEGEGVGVGFFHYIPLSLFYLKLGQIIIEGPRWQAKPVVEKYLLLDIAHYLNSSPYVVKNKLKKLLNYLVY